MSVFHADDWVTIHHANALSLPLEDSSVDLVVTSPPYFGLRSYQDGGEHYDGQIGDEATSSEFLSALVAATREMARVLKPSGSIWVNLGDTYDRKRLAGIPWRYALACVGHDGVPVDMVRDMIRSAHAGEFGPEELMRALDSWSDPLGLILKSEVIWAKTDGLPQAVTDRPRRSHEHWFQFAKSTDCYADIDAVREPYEGTPQRRHSARIKDRRSEGRPVGGWDVKWDQPLAGENPLGKTPGSVWNFATAKLKVPGDLPQHFAAFPTEIPRRIISGWCPDGGTVLDPFGGTGTTALVARALGRRGVHVDLSRDYCRLAQWRVTDPGELARALQVEKPEPVAEDQASLLDLLEGVS